MSDVHVSVELGAGLERRMRVQVPSTRVEREVESRLVKVGKSAKLKGFRPGKVPIHVVRQQFGSQIRQEVLQDLVQSSYAEAVTSRQLRPAGNPRIEAEQMTIGQDFTYVAIFEVYPDFAVSGTAGLAVDRPTTTVTDGDVDLTIDRLRRQKGNWQRVERVAGTGDRITVDFDGKLDGAPIEGGKAEGYAIVIGDGRMLPDFEAGLIGLAAGATATFPVRFPSDYPEENLRGKTVSFDVKAHEVAGRELPPVDAAFVQGYNVASGDVTEFRQLVRDNLAREIAAKVQSELRRQVLEQLLAANPVDLPAVMVGREASGLQAEGMRNLGIKDVKDAPPLSAYDDVARRRVRLQLIIGAVVQEQGIALDQAKFDAKLDELCRAYDKPEEVRRLYLQNADLVAQIENSVIEEQAMMWLIGQAQVRDKSVSFTELMGG